MFRSFPFHRSSLTIIVFSLLYTFKITGAQANNLDAPVSRNDIELIVVTSQHVQTYTDGIVSEESWKKVLREAPRMFLPKSSSGSILSPALQYELHRTLASEPVGLAERKHTITLSDDDNVYFAKSIVEHKRDTYYFSDIVVALENTVKVPLIFDCRPFITNTSIEMLRINVYRSINGQVRQKLLDERIELFNQHMDNAWIIHQPVGLLKESLASYHEFLNATLHIRSPTTGSTIFFDDLSSFSNCPNQGAYVVAENSQIDISKGYLDLQLQSISLFADAYASADIRFGNDNQRDNENLNLNMYEPWWQSVIDLSPQEVLSVLNSSIVNCNTNGNDDNGCDYSLPNAVTGNLNYNPATNRAKNEIPFNVGVGCTNCWSKLSLSMAGRIQFCVNFGVGISGYMGTFQCSSKSTVPECASVGCTYYMNMTLLGSGDFETEIDLLARNLPSNTLNTTTYDSTQTYFPPIPIPGLEAINGKLNPGFVLGSQVKVMGASPYGLNGTAGWNVNAKATNIKMGAQFHAYVYRIADFVTPSSWVKDVKPIYAFTPTLTVSPPILYGLAIDSMKAQFALMPNFQINITMGYPLSSYSLTAISPFIITPNIYIQLQTGEMNSTTTPTGVPSCLGFDTWYALMYGSDFMLKWEGLSIIGVLPSPIGSGTFVIISPQPPVTYPIVNPRLLPISQPYGCVSSTWSRPSSNTDNSPASSSASVPIIAGSIVGAVVVLAAASAGFVFMYRPEWVPTNIGGLNNVLTSKSLPQYSKENPLKSSTSSNVHVQIGGSSNGGGIKGSTQFKVREIMPPRPPLYYTDYNPKKVAL